jgi:hypothetical protein
MTPAKMLRKGGDTYMKLKAVTAGQSLTLFDILTGRATFKRSNVSSREAPARRECTLKKYVLKRGVKTACCTETLVRMERNLDWKLKLLWRNMNLVKVHRISKMYSGPSV